ncbi:MAG: hypothetical protein FJ088_07735, partial [Deltaproteobacteria bacterium]|nr:hypothetical protein [Deltaproteobacteria bacterium]
MFKILFLIFLMIFASCIPELEMKQKKEIVEDTVEEEMFFHEMPEIFDVEDAPDLPDLQDIVEIIDVVDAKDTADIIDVKET